MSQEIVLSDEQMTEIEVELNRQIRDKGQTDRLIAGILIEKIKQITGKDISDGDYTDNGWNWDEDATINYLTLVIYEARNWSEKEETLNREDHYAVQVCFKEEENEYILVCLGLCYGTPFMGVPQIVVAKNPKEASEKWSQSTPATQ